MKQFFQRMTYKMAVWMQGRYGNDDFSNGLVALGIITMLLSIFPHCGWLSYIALIALIVAIWRTCSKNISKRSSENQTYLRVSACSGAFLLLGCSRLGKRQEENRFVKTIRRRSPSPFSETPSLLSHS